MPPGYAPPGGFRCEPPEKKSDEIGEYLTSGAAVRDQEIGLTRTYLVIEDETQRLIGFYTLLADALQLADHERHVDDYRTAPAIKIARFGLCHTLQGRGMGRELFNVVHNQVLTLAEQIGVRYITLDAVADKIGFYQKLNFRFTEVELQATTELDPGSADRSMLFDLGSLAERPTVTVGDEADEDADGGDAGDKATAE